MEEELYAQLNQKYRQLPDEDWTHVEQLKSMEIKASNRLILLTTIIN